MILRQLMHIIRPRFLELVESLGFPIPSYFPGTAFPIEVDHREWVIPSNPMGNILNARCVGDGTFGIDFCSYALS